MNKFVVGLAMASTVLTVAGNALAADMPAKAPPVSFNPCGATRFTGFYAGGNTGAVAYSASRNDLDGFLTDTNTYTSNNIGWTGGVQVGYDWQSCNSVFGVVADWNWANISADTRDEPNDPADPGQGFQSKLRWFSTLRARTGLAVNDTLFYVTGGVAAARVKTTVTEGSNVNPEVTTFNKTRWGMALGGGAEFALGNNWTVNGEVLYLQFAKQQVAGFSADRFDLNDNAWVARLGLNYRWDNPRAAYAASMPVKAAPINPCGVSRFNGGYVGANVGGVSYTAERNDLDGYLTDNNVYSATKAAVTAGAQVGWDWQNCNKVFGVVADWNWTNAKANSRDEPNDPFDPGQGFQSKLSWFSTARVRAGLAADDSLIYVTGGLAAARIKTTITEGSDVDPEVTTFNKTRWGLAAGVGAEFALWDRWTVNSELLYMQFKKQTVSLNSLQDGHPDSFDLVDSAWVSRIGLNYRWDAPTAPKGAGYPCGPQRFNGLYVGANAGGIAYTSDRNDQDGFGVDNGMIRTTDIAATVGGQIGYDWQSCHRLFGVVADFNWSGAKTSANLTDGSTGGLASALTSEMNWYSTFRTRAGVVSNDMLVYVTGGLALANFENTYFTNQTNSIGAPTSSFTRDKTRLGWAGGVGAEYALAGGWSVLAEALYMQFRKETVTLPAYVATGSPANFENYDSAWVGRVGVNYRWGGASTLPVLAKN
jgi:opacity protein-like surface antigen